MAKQDITVELDDETLRNLAVLGNPVEVLARLAHSAADVVLHPGHDRPPPPPPLCARYSI